MPGWDAVRDLAKRGLLETTLVVVMGEFGRTPRINSNTGRDHWAQANTLLLAGGGIAGYRAVGRTNEHGERPVADPNGPEESPPRSITVWASIPRMNSTRRKVVRIKIPSTTVASSKG